LAVRRLPLALADPPRLGVGLGCRPFRRGRTKRSATTLVVGTIIGCFHRLAASGLGGYRRAIASRWHDVDGDEAHFETPPTVSHVGDRNVISAAVLSSAAASMLGGAVGRRSRRHRCRERGRQHGTNADLSFAGQLFRRHDVSKRRSREANPDMTGTLREARASRLRWRE
jgi:hypothetical protein